MSDFSQPVLELRHAAGGPLCFRAGTLHFLTGEPASLRSAWLRVLGLLDAPESGEIFLEDRNVTALTAAERDQIRGERCGFLFAAPFLLPAFSVVENVAMPLFKISRFTPGQARERTDLLLEFTGLTAEAQQPVDELTHFQQHAVSLARALANDPAFITVESLNALSLPDAARFTTLLRLACGRFGVAIIASAAADFPTEPGDCLIPLEGGGVVRA